MVPTTFCSCDIILNFREGNVVSWFPFFQELDGLEPGQPQQDNINKSNDKRKLTWNADFPVKNGDFPASHGDTFRGVNPKHINVQTLRVKSMVLKATNFRSWNTIHKLARKGNAIQWRLVTIKTNHPKGHRFVKTREYCTEPLGMSNHHKMSAKTKLLAIRCFSIKMTLGLPVMAILAFHLGHVPCHHVGVPKVHSKERARRRWSQTNLTEQIRWRIPDPRISHELSLSGFWKIAS